MGIFNFGKKAKNVDGDSSSVVKKGKAPKKNKHQKKAPLSYTALEPFVDSLYGENGFTYSHDGEQLGVVFVLPFSEIQPSQFFLSEKKLEEIKKTFKISKFILVSTKKSKVQNRSFISSILFENLDLEIQKEILKNTKWKVIEKDIKTDEVFERNKIINIDNNLKLYIYWSKKRAFKDYIEKRLVF